MPPSEVRRKTASVVAIGAVIAASVWLRPSRDVPAPLLDARIGSRAGVLVQSPVQSRFRVSSDRGRTGVRVRSSGGRSGVGPGSESGYVPAQLHGTNAPQELRTEPARIALDAVATPSVAAVRAAPPADGHVSRAFASAGRHTAGGFKSAARALQRVAGVVRDRH